MKKVAKLPSSCIGRCKLDTFKVCTGCFRHIDVIKLAFKQLKDVNVKVS